MTLQDKFLSMILIDNDIINNTGLTEDDFDGNA